jgi:DNA-binding response OmpR family regulator
MLRYHAAVTDRTELILLLASDPVIRDVLKEILQRPGYVVLAEGDLGNAVDRIGESVPDLLVIRPYIGNIPGHDAAVYLRKRVPGLPVLIVSGVPEDDRIRNREEEYGFEIFPRPFDPEDLLAKVEEVLAQHPRHVWHHR